MHAHQAGLLLEHVMLGRLGIAARQYVAGADIRMAGKRQFRPRGEDPHPRVVLRIVGRQHEGGLGQVELRRDGLHVGLTQAARLGKHRQRIAAETLLGEHVHRDEAVAGH